MSEIIRKDCNGEWAYSGIIKAEISAFWDIAQEMWAGLWRNR